MILYYRHQHNNNLLQKQQQQQQQPHHRRQRQKRLLRQHSILGLPWKDGEVLLAEGEEDAGIVVVVEEVDGIPVVDLPWRAEPLCPPPTIHRRLRILLILITTRTTNHKHNVPFRCIAVPGFHLVTYRHIYQDLLVLWKNSISAYSSFSVTASISLV